MSAGDGHTQTPIDPARISGNSKQMHISGISNYKSYKSLTKSCTDVFFSEIILLQ